MEIRMRTTTLSNEKHRSVRHFTFAISFIVKFITSLPLCRFRQNMRGFVVSTSYP